MIATMACHRIKHKQRARWCACRHERFLTTARSDSSDLLVVTCLLQSAHGFTEGSAHCMWSTPTPHRSSRAHRASDKSVDASCTGRMLSSSGMNNQSPCNVHRAPERQPTTRTGMASCSAADSVASARILVNR